METKDLKAITRKLAKVNPDADKKALRKAARKMLRRNGN